MALVRYDLIVVGGGFSGFAAALAAARKGVKTLIIEQSNCFGGAAVNNLVNPFMPYFTKKDNGEKLYLSKGVFAEIIERLKQKGALYKNECCFDEEILKDILLDMMEESGADILFDVSLTNVKINGNKIQEITVSGRFGNETLAADNYIDATGDGTLFFLADIPHSVGMGDGNLCQPMTLCFRIANADVEKVWSNRKLMDEKFSEFKKQGKIQNPRENVLIMDSLQKGVVHFNSTRVIKLDPTNMLECSKAEIEARKQTRELFDFLKENIEGFENSKLIQTATQIGIRESRLLDGEYKLTAEDILLETKFEDGIAACNYDMDIHNPNGEGTFHKGLPPGKYYTIPYRCLIPKKIDNLLVAGRCASFTHEAQASVRIMPVCCCMGEAAGMAMAIAFESKTSPRDIDISLLRSRLKENGAIID